MKRDESVTGKAARIRTDELEVADPDTGELGRTVAGRALRVPETLWLKNGRLHWRWGGEAVSAETQKPARGARFAEQANWIDLFRNQLVYPSRGMLAGFVSLAEGSDAEIMAFAKKWGPLGICEHGLPHTHWPLSPWNEHVRRLPPDPAEGDEAGKPCPPKFEVTRPWCQPNGTVEAWQFGGWEPLRAWRQYAREALLIVQTASRLHEDPGTPIRLDRKAVRMLTQQDWKSANTLDDDVEVSWEVIQPAVDRWLGLGDVRIYLHPLAKGRGLTIRFGTAGTPVGENVSLKESLGTVCGLFGALAVQLLLCVHNRGGLAICSACECVYEPTKRPRRDAPTYCAACGKKASARERARKSRAKKAKLAATTKISRKTAGKPMRTPAQALPPKAGGKLGRRRR